MFRYAAVLLTALICSHGIAADEWVPLYEGKNGNRAYLKNSSIRVDGNKRTYWQKYEYQTPVPDKYEQGKMLKNYMSKSEVDCAQETTAVLSEIGYQPDGTTLYRIDPVVKNTMAVVPDTRGALTANKVCSY